VQQRVVPCKVVHVQQTEAARKITSVIYPHLRSVSLAEAMGDVKAAQGLALLLKKTVESHITPDGRLDWLDVATDLLAWMRENQR
jgi:hypothetical protein